MKKLFRLMMILFVCFILAGCGDNKTENNGDKDSENINQTINNDELDIVSTDDKLVFTDTDGYLLIYNYDGETLESITWIMELIDEETAIAVEQVYNSAEYKDVYSVTREEEVVTINYGESMLAGYNSIPKSQMESYMIGAGYNIKK